jgi:hypothetical protein
MASESRRPGRLFGRGADVYFPPFIFDSPTATRPKIECHFSQLIS